MKWITLACFAMSLALVARAQPPPAPQSEEDPDTHQCNLMMCRMLCPLGFVTDEYGCARCECLQDPCKEEDVCAPGETCEVRHTCTEHPCHHDHVEPQCIPQLPCAVPMCMTRCENGYKDDERGCMTCQCNEQEPHPCDGYECPISHQCMPIPENLPEHMVEGVLRNLEALCVHSSQMDSFLNRFGLGAGPDDEEEPEMPHPPEPFRPMPGLCHQYMERFRHLDAPAARPFEHLLAANCHDDGSFKPAMCNWAEQVCWCVDDAGRKIDDTEMQMTRGGERPVCEEHKTVYTDLVIVFEHDIVENLEEHLEALGESIIQQLSEWTGLEEAFIEVQAVNAYGDNSEYIKVELQLKTDDQISLPFVTAHLLWNMIHNGFVVSCGEATLTPVPDQFLAHHHSYPVEEPRQRDSSSSSSESWEDSDEYSGRCGRIWREHRGLLVVAGVGGGIFLIVIIILIASCFKRRFAAKAQFSHKRMDNYKENVAYANDMMSSHPDAVITEKTGRADLYKVTLPDNQEKY